jgi:Type-F conjugative transfer system protein (TrbI_Ftype)
MARNRLASGDAAAGDGPLFEDNAGLQSAAGQAAVPPAAPPRRMGWMPVALVGGLVAAGLWGAWVTKNLLADEGAAPMARVQLSAIVGEYVQAQARSATPPEQVTAETRAFMAEIQRNLEARGTKGQIVLVGEAVLAGNVPDITANLRKEVYAKIRMPQPAALGANDVMGAMRSAMAEPAAAPKGGLAGGQGRGPGY